MKKEKNTYITPLLTVVEFKTERGYALSANVFDPGMQAAQAINDFIDEERSIQVAQQNGLTGEAIGGQMYGNEDNSNPGGSSNWQYSNGGWF